MDYNKEMINYFAKILISEYGVDENDLLFKSTSKDSVDVFFKGCLILSVDYTVFEHITKRMVDIIITNCINNSKERNMLSLSKYCDYDLEFQNNIIKLLEEVDFTIVEFTTNKETTVVNNAQEIIKITNKAKEENIKKDIEDIESKILEAARNGNESVMFKFTEFKTDFDSLNQYDNEIVKHFRNKGFECSIDSYSLGRGFLKIKWGD